MSNAQGKQGKQETNHPNGSEVSMTERLVALFQHMPEGVALHELVYGSKGEPIDYRVLDVNPQFEKHMGIRRSDVVGKLGSAALGAWPAPDLEKYAAVAMGGPPLHMEVYSQPLNRYFSVSVAPLGAKAFATIFSDITPLKIQAEAIEKSRLSQRALLDNQPHLAWLKDREGRFLAVNKAFAQACGQPSPEAVVGKTDLDVWPVELAEAYRADDRAVMKSGVQKAVEEEIANVDGTKWFETYKSPVFEPDGSVVGTTGVARDITQRKWAEASRLRSERKLGQILDLTPDPIAVTNQEDEITFINQAFCELIGYQRSEILGQKMAKLQAWEKPELMTTARERLSRDGYIDTIEMPMLSKDKTRHQVEVSVAQVEFDEATAMIFAGRDVTESRHAERAASRSRKQLLSVSELAHIGHFSIDLASGAATWTPELYRIFGRDPECFQPAVDTVRALFHAEDRAAVDRSVLAVRDTCNAQQVHFRVVRPNGEIRYCLSIIEAEGSSVPPAQIIYGLVQDLTELRRAEEEQRKLEQQVMQSQKLESLGVLAGGIAHDFNNLLTSILGNADMALSELAPTNPARQSIEDIEIVSRRAADLCRQMLAYSGKGRFVVQAISLNDIVREMAHLLSISISKKVVIKYNFYADLPSVMADATQMRQVVMNLITNASEAIAEVSGVVTLSTGVMDCDDEYLKEAIGDRNINPAGPYVYLEVADTGCGMEPETLDRIFDPFFTTKFTGRGLGLAAVLGIVRGHKGALRVYSEKKRGTTFKILLPAHYQSAPGPDAVSDNTEAWRGKGLVLLADDEDSIRTMGRRLLERAGFDVVVAGDGRQALDLFTQYQSKVRLVILDMTMPHLDGEGCFRELRRVDPKVRVIMTSGYNEQDVLSRFVGKGLAGFVQKPYNASDLLPRIRKVLGEDP
jgi:two-component system, cell cycle sensor histidine kinase and response regulator CckA